MLLLKWGESPLAKAYDIDLGSLIGRHVNFAFFTESEYQKIRSLASQVSQAEHVEGLWGKCNRGTHTNNLFADLFKLHQSRYKIENATERTKPPFLGYWINLIPSQPDFGRASIYFVHGKQQDYSENEYAPAGKLETLAYNGASMTLDTNDEMKWWLPHHGIYISDISFADQLRDDLRMQLYISVDGRAWDILFDSMLCEAPRSTSKFPCRSTVCASWFKLCIRQGHYSNRLQVHGIMQSV
jgi:hypothetical protein